MIVPHNGGKMEINVKITLIGLIASAIFACGERAWA